MLRELRVADMAVIAAARLEPGRGFTALTGETGSGKSVCVSALRASVGGRCDADVVRPGAAAGRVTAVLDAVPPALRDLLATLGVPDDELLTLTREVVPGGRGSCRINGALVSVGVLRQVGDAMVEVTLQGASQRLQRAGWQRDLLDHSGGQAVGAARARGSEAIQRWRGARQQLSAARTAAASTEVAVQRARELIADLGALGLQPDEPAALAAERLRLRHAARLAGAAEALALAAGGDEYGAADVLAAALAATQELGALDEPLRALGEEGERILENLRDLSLEARRYAGLAIVDDARLEEVEARLDVLARVQRRHGSLEQALLDLDEARRLIDAVEGGEGAIDRLEATLLASARDAAAAAGALSELRQQASRALERSVTERLKHLDLPHARFRVGLGRSPDAEGLELADGVPVRCGDHGIDDVQFRLTTNADMVPVPLEQGPSGGELSRLALALAAEVSDCAAPLLVLDEVDAGIGGETAARVGDMLAHLGRSQQVIAVTHRPEIAARAGTHLVVSKEETATGSATTVSSVSGDRRVHEVARLMSGRVTQAALRRAAELLEEGRSAAAPTEAAGAAGRTM